MRNFEVYLGASDWRHDGWRGEFYPDDMPEEWELSFYNTQFRCVFLSKQVWMEASDEEVKNWLADTQEDFHFVLETYPEMDEYQCYRASRFGLRGKLSNAVRVEWLDGDTDLRKLAQLIRNEVARGQLLYLLAPAEALPQLRQVSELLEVLGV